MELYNGVIYYTSLPAVIQSIFVDFPGALLYNKGCEYPGQSRGQGESLFMRKVRAPQGKDNG